MRTESFSSANPALLEGKMIDLFKDGFRPTLAFVFCSPTQDFKEIGQIFDRFGVELLGCTTAGEITNAELFDSSISILLMEMKRENFQTVFVKNTEGVVETAQAIRNFADKAFANPAIITCSGGVLNDGEQIVAGLTHLTNRDIPIFGGLAGDDLNIQNTSVFWLKTYVF